MPDFLTRLVERSAGRAPVAQPVVPPMFAPDSDVPVAYRPPPAREIPVAGEARGLRDGRLLSLPDHTRDTGTTDNGLIDDDGAGMYTSLPKRLRDGVRGVREVSDQPGQIRILPIGKSRLNGISPGPAAGDDGDHAGPALPSGAFPADHTPVVSSPGSAGIAVPATRDIAPLKPGVIGDTGLEISEHKPSSGAGVTVRDRPDEKSRLSQYADGKLTDGRKRISVVANPGKPGKEKMVSDREPSAFSARDAPQQPVVRVTIGRIEVRAVNRPEHARPQEKVPATPKLSLDKYLKLREGEKS